MALTDEALRRFLAHSLSVDIANITRSTPLFSSGIIDSLQMLELMVFIEKSYGFRVSATELTMENLDSIDRILAFAASKG